MLKEKLVENAVSSFAGYCTDLGLSALINHARQSLDKGRIRANLTEYILRQRKINDVSILAEEIDFQGLIEYITRQLPDELETRLFSSSNWQRKKARENIINEAIQYSDAKSSESQKRVSTCIGVCLDIIRDYYKKQFTHKDYVLIDEIAQEVVDSLVPTIENNHTMVSCDKAVSLAEKRDFETMEHEITKGLECASTQHPLAPYYGYDYHNRQLISVPNSEEAKKLYPPTLSLSGKTIKVGDSGFIGAMGDPFTYSYRHQLPLTFEVSNAKKYLGKEEDPIQSEATALIGKEIRFEPPEFPDAFPCAIKVGTVVFFEYVLLRTAIILDDGTYVINNHEQLQTIQFEFRINPKDPHKSSIKASYNHPSNKERLQFVRFMNTLTHDKDFHIYVLSKGVDLLAGKVDGMEYHTAFPSIEEEIDFLERVCAIEDRFSIVLTIEDDIFMDEHDTIVHLSDMIRLGKYIGTWSEWSFDLQIDAQSREQILSINDSPHQFTQVSPCHINLFKADIDCTITRTISCAYIRNIDKVKEKLSVLEDGDILKLSFYPGKDNSFVDMFDTLSCDAKISF